MFKLYVLKLKARLTYLYLLPMLMALLCSGVAVAQSSLNTGQPTTLTNTPQRDTNANKSNTNKWKSQDARIYIKKLNTERIFYPDTSVHTFNRLPYSQPWNRDLGNLGSPAQSLLFTPEDRLGPTLGYHVMDAYRFCPDSLNFYNTTRPYSIFSFHLGSKLEQVSELMITENIRPNWNFGVQYRKTVSPGFYKTERNNHDNANFTTNYKSNNQHYELNAALVYNKEQHDENGGTTDSQLNNADYSDRQTVTTNYQNDRYSITRSPVFNTQRDFGLLLQHSYTWGTGDTTYNTDSTSYTYKLVPRFRITHKMELSTEKHDFKDLTPNEGRYQTLFDHAFTNNGYYTPNLTDTVFSEQKWLWIDNRVLLNGFFGKPGRQLAFNAGVGNRYDQFATSFGSNTDNRTSIISNYLIGEVKKEALMPGQWFYRANAQFFVTGSEAGDFLLHGALGRDLKHDAGSLSAGFQQQLNSAPYNYTLYQNEYVALQRSFNKESITEAYGTLQATRFKFSAGVKLYVIANYIYINEQQRPDQYSTAFNLTEVWLRKVFKIGSIYLDNELVYQTITGTAPVNIPAVLGRHQLSYERGLFGNALRIAMGIMIQYNTAYHPNGYDPLLNRFYYQNSYYLGSSANTPELSVFFNFKVTKRFRAFIAADELQQALFDTKINYPGYPAQDVTIRFGFSWVLIN